MKALDPDGPSNVVTFAKGFDGPVALELTPDSSLLVLNRDTIRRDAKDFIPNRGSLVRIRQSGVVGTSARQETTRPPLPATLEASGLFTVPVRASWCRVRLKNPWPWNASGATTRPACRPFP